MNKWQNFKKDIDNLTKSNKTKKEIISYWKKIQVAVRDYKPSHLVTLIDAIDQKQPNKTSKILDHGCGDSITLFFLAAKGYTDIWGVDVNNSESFNKRKRFNNKVFKIILEKGNDRIFNYDGKTLPFKSSSFDFIFSQQVVEHIEGSLLDKYISQEARVLKNNGLALHQIPHRLGPFEGHTKKWFIHWLPKNIYHHFLKKDKVKLDLVMNALFLKWPWELKHVFKKHFSSVSNINECRLKFDVYSDEYSVRERIIRKALVNLFRIPIVGNFFIKLFSVFFQLEILLSNK